MEFSLEFSESAHIDNLTVRKEGPEKDITAIDVKVSGIVDGSALYHILGCSVAKAEHFWDLTSDETREAFSGITQIKCWSSFENCDVTFGSVGAKKFSAAKVRRFVLKPVKNRMIDLSCLIALSDIHGADAGFLCDRAGERIALSIVGQPELFED